MGFFALIVVTGSAAGEETIFFSRKANSSTRRI